MMSQNHSRRRHRLVLYEECLGPLRELVPEEDGLIACVGSINLILPPEMKQVLNRFWSRRSRFCGRIFLEKYTCYESFKKID